MMGSVTRPRPISSCFRAFGALILRAKLLGGLAFFVPISRGDCGRCVNAPAYCSGTQGCRLGTGPLHGHKSRMEIRSALIAGVFAVAFGLMAHALVGHVPFPFGDDFAYAPLAEYKMNDALFARDDQLRMFANHALVYEWLYWMGQNGPGLGPVFHAAVIALAVVCSGAMMAALGGFGAPVMALPVVLALGVLGSLDGLGRGDFGGLIGAFFHHHNVALACVLLAVVAALGRRVGVAGLCLAGAAYAQPMTAIHGAWIVGFGVLFAQPRATWRLAFVALIAALPAVWIVGRGVLAGGGADVAQIDLITDAYRFRAPHHYDPLWRDIGVTTLYLLAGWIGAALIAGADRWLGRFGVGLMVAFTVLHAVTVVVYKLGVGETSALFILDANRSTPLVFVLGPVLAVAGMWRGGAGPASLSGAVVLAAIMVVNGSAAGAVMLAAGVAILFMHRAAWAPRAATVGACLAVPLVFPPATLPLFVPAETRDVLAQIRAQTPQDALFVIPVGLSSFRHYAQRSAYVDFKLFSVAQPAQAALTRARIDQVLAPRAEHAEAIGWPAIALWDEDQRQAGTCDAMSAILRATGADYYVRAMAPEEVPPTCEGLARPITGATLAVYGVVE